MRVSHLSVLNFRNYASADLELLPGLNIFVGSNGQGKTNLVEAIHFFTGLQSHRVNSDVALIRSGHLNAVVRLQIVINDRPVLLELQINSKSKNRALINKVKAETKDVTRWFSSVIFAPEDLQLVRGEPSVRRKFLDNTYALIFPGHRGVLADYERALKQRNALLRTMQLSKNAPALIDTLAIWDERLVELGSTILFARRATMELLKKPLTSNYNHLVNGNHQPTLHLEETFFDNSNNVSRETNPLSGEKFNSNRGKWHGEPGLNVSRETIAIQFTDQLRSAQSEEIRRGVSLVGPHRDDVNFSLNNLPIKGFASHGETWSYVLSLKLAQVEIVKEFSNTGDPVVILDDVFAELDSDRRIRLLEIVEKLEQVIVTAAVAEDIPKIHTWNVHSVHMGTLSAAKDHSIPDVSDVGEVCVHQGSSSADHTR